MIEIYAITEDPPPPLPENMLAVRSAGLVALCAPTQEQDEDVTPALLWRREEVIESLMEHCNLLPVRFGARVEDEAAVARLLGERSDELLQALERVRGAVELSVRVLGGTPDVDAPDPGASGADYLRARVRRATAEAVTASGVHAPLTKLARESTQHDGRAARELLRGAYLVDRRTVDSFVEWVAALQDANPHLRLLCTGPWPPYSFTGR